MRPRTTSTRFSAEELALGRALQGDGEGLREVLASPEQMADMHHQGVAPLLFLRAHELEDDESLDQLRPLAVRTAGWWVISEEVMRSVGQVFAAAGVCWLPLKGMDTAARFFDSPELRPTSDLDLLVKPEHFDAAVAALENAGWRFHSSPRIDAYVRGEGYNLALSDGAGSMIELHFRLWGFIPEWTVADLWQAAEPDAALGPTGHRVSVPHAFVVCAVHAWVHLGEPRMIYWWELKLIAEHSDEGFCEAVQRAASGWGLQLPVALAAEVVDALFGSQRCAAIAESLQGELRWPERRMAEAARRRGIRTASLARFYIARLLARRPSRMGWKAPIRRVWWHPGMVEERTPEHWPWWKRRAWSVLNGLRLVRLAEPVRRPGG